MAEVNLTINGRSYGIACDDGQEKRLRDLGYYVDQRIREIAKAGAASNETHLMVLASLMLADEVFDLRDNLGAIDEQVQITQSLVRDDSAIAEAINELAGRVGEIADRIQKA